MKLDIRVPIGLLFTLIGALLVIQGLLTGVAAQGVVVGLNLNVCWGAVLIAFGVSMLLLARRRNPH